MYTLFIKSGLMLPAYQSASAEVVQIMAQCATYHATSFADVKIMPLS